MSFSTSPSCNCCGDPCDGFCLLPTIPNQVMASIPSGKFSANNFWVVQRNAFGIASVIASIEDLCSSCIDIGGNYILDFDNLNQTDNNLLWTYKQTNFCNVRVEFYTLSGPEFTACDLEENEFSLDFSILFSISCRIQNGRKFCIAHLNMGASVPFETHHYLCRPRGYRSSSTIALMADGSFGKGEDLNLSFDIKKAPDEIAKYCDNEEFTAQVQAI